MNRKNLTAAVLAGLAGAAGIAGTAQAVNINPDGLGQVLIYPYYTVNNGNSTLLSVVNTSEDAQAVKVRFLEGQNSREVLDFNLYLSGWDVWIAEVGNDDGTPTLYSVDNSCTVPYLYETKPAQPFLTLALDDGGSDDISRATEGYVEMISMGEVHGAMEANVSHVWHEVLSADKKTVIDEFWAPANCAALTAAWTDSNDPAKQGQWMKDWYATGADQDAYGYTYIDSPQGGLFGGGSIVNVANGTLFTYDARAINGFEDDEYGGVEDSFDEFNNVSTEGNSSAHLHARPGFITPNLSSGDTDHAYVFGDDGDVFESGEFEASIDAVSYVFMHDAVMNEYITIGEAAETEWVVTFPTKSFYVNGGFAPSGTQKSDQSGRGVACTAVKKDGKETGDYTCKDTVPAPFTEEWDGEGACEPVSLDKLWDQNEAFPGSAGSPSEEIPPVVSPSDPSDFGGGEVEPFQLCFEAQVIRFGTYDGAPGADYAGPTEILGSSNVININNDLISNDGPNDLVSLPFEAGWLRIDMHNYKIDDCNIGNCENGDGVINKDDSKRTRPGLYSGDGHGLVGLPVTGFSVNRFTNNFLDGGNTLANYGGIFNHKGTRGLCTSEGACAASVVGDGNND